MITVATKQKIKLLVIFSFLLAVSLSSVFSRSQSPVYGETNGRIAYTLFDGSHQQIYTINADGTGQTQLTADSNDNGEPVWSPDGTKIAYASFDGSSDFIKIMDADGSNQTTITDGLQYDFLPAWSPDGTKLAFVSDDSLEIMNIDGSDRQVLYTDSSSDFTPSWKPDSSSIIFACSDTGNIQICSINPDGTGETQITNDAHDHNFPSWSPDGTKISLVYTVSRYDDELAVMDPDGSNIQVIPTSNNEVRTPSWSPDGNKILFNNSDSGLAIDRIYTINADGTDETVVTPNDGFESNDPSWQPVLTTDNDNDSSTDATEAAAPNSGDANGDGLADKLQANVTSLVNTVSGKYTVLQSSCTSNNSVSIAATPSDFKDAAFTYPEGLLGFTLHCSAAGATATVNQYYFGLVTSSTQLLRKYSPVSHVYQTIPGVTISAVTIGGQAATKATYQIKDGGPLDQDGSANGQIVDPVGIAVPAVGAPDTGLGGTAR